MGFDLGRELARRLGVPFEPVVYPSPGAIIAGLKSSEWDLTFFGPTPERDSVLNFTEPLLVIEHGYLVLAGSPFSTIDAVDQLGIRIGAPQGGSVNAFLKRALRNATVVANPSDPAGEEMLKSGKVDASPHLSTRQYARIVGGRVNEIGLDPAGCGTHSIRRTKPTLIYRRTRNLRAVQLLLGPTKLESTARY